MLDRFGLSQQAFGQFLEMPFDEIMAQARSVAAGGDPAWPFLARPAVPVLGFEDRVTDPAPRQAIDARRIIVDRPIHFYMLRAFHRMSDAEFADRVSIAGKEHLDEAVASGRGLFVLNSHFGPGHVLPILLARLGHRMTGLTASDIYSALDIDIGEQFKPLPLSTMFLPRALALAGETLAAGGIVHSTGDGYRVRFAPRRRFLGRYRPFAEGTGYLCHSTGARCLPVFSRIDEYGQLRVDFGPPIDAGPSAASLRDVIDRVVDRYIALLERRWLSDFGNVSPHVLRQFANQTMDTAAG